MLQIIIMQLLAQGYILVGQDSIVVGEEGKAITLGPGEVGVVSYFCAKDKEFAATIKSTTGAHNYTPNDTTQIQGGCSFSELVFPISGDIEVSYTGLHKGCYILLTRLKK